jgi:ABC-2 type transport system ATP-binding protein
MISTKILCKEYGNHGAVRGLSMNVPAGACFALVGANGAGKTTTIKLLMNLLEPSSGSASVFGVDSRKLGRPEFQKIGYVSENQDFSGRLNVKEFFDYLRPFYPTWDVQLERSIMHMMGLPPDRKIGELSHGMRMKMALATALPFRPSLLVLDEPFNGLDSLIREELMEQLSQQVGKMTIFISSHDLADIESFITHVGFLEKGKLLFEESMAQLSGRFRQVRLTLDSTVKVDTPLQPIPESWLGFTTTENVVSFVDSQFSEAGLRIEIERCWGYPQSPDIRPMNFKDIFTSIARSSQNGARPG